MKFLVLFQFSAIEVVSTVYGIERTLDMTF